MPKENKKPIHFIGVVALGIGSMVGAGIFTLLGLAGAQAGNGIYVALILGGTMALLTGYSYSKLSQRFPSSGGIAEFLIRGFGPGKLSGSVALIYDLTLIIASALIAKSFAAYAVSLFFGETPLEPFNNLFATGIVLFLAFINFLSANIFNKTEKIIVFTKIAILAVFITIGLTFLKVDTLFSGHSEGVGSILSATGLIFFAYTGFSIMTNTAKDVQDPKRTIPRAIFTAIIIVMLLYLAIALVVFGNLSLSEIITYKTTVLAQTAKPVLGQFGFVMVSIAALLACASAINANLYGSSRISNELSRYGQLPKSLSHHAWRNGTKGLVLAVGIILILVNSFDLPSMAVAGSGAFLLSYLAVNIAHVKLLKETGAVPFVIFLATAAILFVSIVFVISNIETNPMALIILFSLLTLCFLTEIILRKRNKD